MWYGMCECMFQVITFRKSFGMMILNKSLWSCLIKVSNELEAVHANTHFCWHNQIHFNNTLKIKILK